jgi:hypothetical protein
MDKIDIGASGGEMDNDKLDCSIPYMNKFSDNAVEMQCPEIKNAY